VNLSVIAWVKLRLGTLLRFFSTAAIVDSDLSEPLDSAAHPSETAFLIRVGIENPCDLSGRGKEIPVNEGVVLGEKHAKTGMRVIPADNAILGIFLILHRIDVLPGILGEGNVGASLFSVLALNAGRNLDAVIAILADEHAADFGFVACCRIWRTTSLSTTSVGCAFDGFAFAFMTSAVQ
jgi:hypothetical protein